MRQPKVKNTRKIAGIIVAFITIIVGSIALYYVKTKEDNDNDSKEYYESLRDEIKVQPTDESLNEEFTVDWESLKDCNVVAWIKFGETVDYPVVQGKDNSYYLKHMPNGNYNAGGSIFLNADNASDFTDPNSIIYGHNMMSGAMFGEFKKYVSQVKEIPTDIYLYLPDGTKHIYKVFSINKTMYNGIAYKIDFKDIMEYEDYQNKLLETSALDMGGITDTSKRILTMSTCSVIGSKQGNRVVITGMEKYIKQIQEPASWYKPKQLESPTPDDNYEEFQD